MKITDPDDRIHVLNNSSTIMSVVNDIAMSGVQEEAFYVLDIGDVVEKHQIWKEKLPRVQPFYGNLLILGICLRTKVFQCSSSRKDLPQSTQIKTKNKNQIKIFFKFKNQLKITN